MKKLMLFIILAVVAGMVVQTIHAELVTGNVGFTGSITIDTSSIGTADTITGWINVQVSPSQPTGTFTNGPNAIVPGMPVTMTSNVWAFGSSSPITNFLSVGGYNFEFVSTWVLYQGFTVPGLDGYLIIGCKGVVSGNGYTPTAFTGSFASQDPKAGANPDSWSFSGSLNSLNSNGAPVLVSSAIINAAILTWSDPTFTLQAATNLNGSYNDVPGATSPYTNSTAGAQQFFRLRQ